MILWLALRSPQASSLRCSSASIVGLVHHRGARACDGRRAQSDFGRLRGAVRRPRRRFRHPVQRALPRGALRGRRSARRAGECRRACRRAADARRRRHRGRLLSFLPTDYKGVSELGQIAGAGMLIAYLTSITLLPALLACSIRPAKRSRSAIRRSRRSTVSWSATAFRSSSSPRWSRSAAAAALFPAVRLQPDQPAQPEGRIGRDLSRPAPRSQRRRQLRSTCSRRTLAAAARDRRALAEVAGGRRAS